MIAIILAGGKGSRIGTEKALIELGSRKLIDLIVKSVRGSKVADFSVAITKNTPKTAAYCKRANYKTIETSGGGYHADLRLLLQRYPEFVSVACDLPFLRSEHINALIDAYLRYHISITGAVHRDIIKNGIIGGYTFTHEGKEVVACGINVVTGSRESVPLVFDDPMLAINVNTVSDLRVARRAYRHYLCLIRTTN
ncbi:MAG: NTP transferase domain-containing protein [Halobacteriota archaeon]